MITPDEAEALANKLIGEYLTACKLDTQQQAGDALMKLVSVAGLAMCATVGQHQAVERLLGTATYISKPQFAGPWKREAVQ